jgi:hypothetical protein
MYVLVQWWSLKWPCLMGYMMTNFSPWRSWKQEVTFACSRSSFYVFFFVNVILPVKVGWLCFVFYIFVHWFVWAQSQFHGWIIIFTRNTCHFMCPMCGQTHIPSGKLT